MKGIIYISITIFVLLSCRDAITQPWQQNDAIFNPSGVPSLPFSQPRFADLDGDGDSDLIIGNIDNGPFYMENIGSATIPEFAANEQVFSEVSSLDAEVGVCCDIDNDGDLDFISGGYTGLNLFINIGTVNSPVFEKSAGFFSGLNAGQNPVPDLADIDNDGDPDLVVGFSESGLVKLYSNIGSPETAVFNESDATEVGDVGLYAYPNLCDLDSDGDNDLLVGRDQHGFIYYRNVGDIYNPVWQANPLLFAGIGSETYWNSPGFTDMNGDGKFDLIFGTASGPLNYYINSGTPSDPEWELNTELFGGVLDVGGASNPCLFDFDADGDLDLFSGSQLGDIKYYKNTGTASGPAWEENSGNFTSLKHSIYSAVAIGDVNGDGLADAIVGDLSGNLFYHRNTGLGFIFESEALQSISLGGWSAPRLVNFDNDDDLDIVAGNEAGNLTYLENQGTATSPDWVLIPGYFGNIDVGTNCVPAFCDIDFDGDQDMACGNLWGDIFFYENQDGNWIENAEIVDGISGEQNTTPAFGDLDADGDPDLVLGQYSGIFNYFGNQNIITKIPDRKLAAASIDAFVYPNPFTNYVYVDLTLTEEFIITVYNIQGQRILQQAGTSPSILLDLSGIKSGMYFLRIIGERTAKTLQIIKN